MIRKLNKYIIGLIIAYLLMVVAIFIFLMQLESIHNRQQTVFENDMKQSVTTIIKENKDVKNNLDKLYQNNRIELVVLDENDKEVYASIHLKDFNNLKDDINSKVIGKRMIYAVAVEDHQYLVCLIVYYQLVQDFYNQLIIIITIILLILISIIFVIFFIFNRLVSNPLYVLEKQIVKLEKYEFKSINNNDEFERYSSLSKSLMDFAKKIDHSIELVSEDFVNVNKELTSLKSQRELKNQMISSIIHNLKTPISIANINLYNALKTNDLERIKKSIAILEKLPNDINEIMSVSLDNTQYNKISSFDIVKYINNIINDSNVILERKGLFVNFVAKKEIVISTYQAIVEQIILISIENSIKYAINDTMIDISVFVENDKLYYEIANKANRLSKTQLNDIFNLFTRIDDQQEGSGSGLFLLKQFVEYLNGKVAIDYQDNKMILKVKIPI